MFLVGSIGKTPCSFRGGGMKYFLLRNWMMGHLPKKLYAVSQLIILTSTKQLSNKQSTMDFNTPHSSLLADHFEQREDGALELNLDMPPSGDFSAFVEAIRACHEDISVVHVHKMFMRDLTDEQQAEVLDSLHDLKELHVSFGAIPVRSLANLLLRSKQLGNLSLDRVLLISEPSEAGSSDDAVLFSALQGLESLKIFHFCLSASNTAPEGKKLFFQVDDEFDTLFQSLSGIRSLQKVYVSIGKNFAENSNIQHGTLKSLMANTGVQDFSLVHFPLHEGHCQAIVEAGSNLTSLSLVKAGLRDEAALILANGLSNMSLKTLSLPGNKIGDMGAKSIAQALSSQDSSLEVLDLNSNLFTAAIGHQLGALLENNPTIAYLDISNNMSLGDATIQSMVPALSSNTTLQSLNLFGTGLTNKSSEAIAQVLRVNTTLKQLNLYHNDEIDSKGIQVLAQTLEQFNFDLERLEISKKRTETDFGLEMYLRLNREYNRRAMETLTSEVEYLNGIYQAVQSRDMDSIYYFLQGKPSLCCGGC
jgi:Leucine Rich repeat